MKTERYYQSILAPHMQTFIDRRKAFGMDTDRFECFFSELDKFAKSQGIKEPYDLNREFYAKWRKSRVNDHEKTIYAKLIMLRHFAKYLNTTGYVCHIPTLPRTPYNNFSPYIFSHDEMTAIFAEYDKLLAYDARMGISNISMPAIIRTLYSTGMRVSECISLKNKDVNLGTGIIHIRVSKTKNERLAVISQSLKSVLVQYVKYRDALPLKNVTSPEAPFFVKTDGTMVIAHRVLDRFHRVLKVCKIPEVPLGQQPRVHDLRHTYAVHTMESMLNAGIDLYTAMPILMTALGHKSLNSTGEYVRLTAAMCPHLKAQCEPINNIIFHEHKTQPKID